MNLDINNLNTMLIDVFREIGNIGSGNAATALASMINKKIDMKVPTVNILEFKEVDKLLGGAEEIVVGIYFEMSGDVVGNLLLAFGLKSAVNLVNMLFSREFEDRDLDEMDMSALSEIGNILAASYVNSICKMTSLNIKISVPSVSIDMAGAILSVPAVQFSQIGDNVLFIETEFFEDSKIVSGDLFLIPDLDSYQKILQSLGIS
ncbi:chemotaxis protein CheC [Clostridiaceae bacterium M8S5]|nr:chemotaxis protein CheC [Clostridiaceae bacterium M8S5]